MSGPESLGKPASAAGPDLAPIRIVSPSANALLEERHTPLPASAEGAARAPAVEFSHVSLAFDDLVVLDDLSFSLSKGAMRILLGESGSGKSVVLKLILGLLRPDAGTIVVNGHRVDTLAERDLLRMRESIGMVFQENALFDSLTVAENVGYRLFEEGRMPADQAQARVEHVLGFVGLTEFIDRLPSELSGGQRRRVAIARAIAPAPDLLLFDDPITGLDPIIATSIDNEVIKLRDLERTTALLVTHQIRDAFYIATHRAARDNGRVQIVPFNDRTATQIEFMVLHNGRIHFQGVAEALLASRDPYLRHYLLKTLPPW
jgi:phospholipid/cholesterol/gamma-HCH transport system ATP-binding protein